MRIVSLEPFLTEIIASLGLADFLVGVSHRCDFPESIQSLPRLTSGLAQNTRENVCASGTVDLEVLKALAPDTVLTSLAGRDDDGLRLKTVKEKLAPYLPADAKIFSYQPRTFEQVLQTFERVGKDLGDERRGLSLAQKLKAQSMDWCDNFYERMKNKRITFISAYEPLTLAGLWIPDMIKLCSAASQVTPGGEDDRVVKWQDILAFRPDVIVVAPRDMQLMDAAMLFKTMEKLPEWESIPAVKRGEVYFCDGLRHFHRPSPRLIDSMAVLISAIAGFESGYITARDTFYRLRWLEMQRHRFGDKK